MAKDKKQFVIYVDDLLHKELKELAVKEDRSMVSMLRMIVKDYKGK